MPTLRVGQCLNLALGIWARNFLPFTGLTVLFTFASLSVLLLFPTIEEPGSDVEKLPEFLVGTYSLLACNMLVGTLLTGMLTYAVTRQLLGHQPPLGEALGVGLRRIFPVIGTTFCFGMLAGLGTLALIVPGILVVCAYYVCVPACVIERPGIFGALQRSSSLTRGHRMTIFLLVLALLALFIPLSLGINLAVKQLDITYRAQLVIETLLQTPFASLNAIVPTVMYSELRRIKEGVAGDELAKVFE